jgi:hypothetical protein
MQRCLRLGCSRQLLVLLACCAVHGPHLTEKIGDLGLHVNIQNVLVHVRFFQPGVHRIIYTPVCRRRATVTFQKIQEAILETPDGVVALEEGLNRRFFFF